MPGCELVEKEGYDKPMCEMVKTTTNVDEQPKKSSDALNKFKKAGKEAGKKALVVKKIQEEVESSKEEAAAAAAAAALAAANAKGKWKKSSTGYKIVGGAVGQVDGTRRYTHGSAGIFTS